MQNERKELIAFRKDISEKTESFHVIKAKKAKELEIGKKGVNC